MKKCSFAKRISILFIAVLLILPLSSCSTKQEKTVTLSIGRTLPSNKEVTHFNRSFSVNKNEIIEKLKTAEYTETDRMTDDFEAARITFDEATESILLLAFDYATDVLYAQYADDIYTVEDYDALVSFIGGFIDWNQYTLLSGISDVNGEMTESEGSEVHWDGVWRAKKYFYNNECRMENVFIYNETSENTEKTPRQLLDKSLDFLKLSDVYAAFIMYDETSDKWLVEIYPHKEDVSEDSYDTYFDAFYDVVLDRFGNILWIDSPQGLKVLEKT